MMKSRTRNEVRKVLCLATVRATNVEDLGQLADEESDQDYQFPPICSLVHSRQGQRSVLLLLDYAAKERLYEKADPCQVHPLWHIVRSASWRGHREIICLFLGYGVDANEIPIS